MKKYNITNLKEIFQYAGINITIIEGTRVPLTDIGRLRMKGKIKKVATYGELDLFAVYQKVIFLMEFTSKEKIDTTHFDRFKTKIELLLDGKRGKLKEFVKKLKEKYQDENKGLKDIDTDDIENFTVKGIYVHPTLDEPEEETLKQRISTKDKKIIYIWGKDTFEYFKIICSSIRNYSKYELFSYFDIKPEYVFDKKELESRTSFCPINKVVKIEKGIFGCTMITFNISPDLLLEKTYVLRNEGWKGDSFQRMIISSKLGNIRNYILKHKDTSFANNIIISLSPNINKEEVERGEFCLPLMFGSLCLIDGQHRLLAFTQDFYGEKKKEEKNNDRRLKKLSGEIDLLVTLIIFNGSQDEILKNQTQLFLDINSNQTRIKTDFVYNLKEITEPKSLESIGNKILRYLNFREEGVFRNKFEIRSYYKGRIKRSSIIKWGLSDIVDTEKSFLFFLAPKTIKDQLEDSNIDEYIRFCGEKLEKYFRIIKEVFQDKYGKECWDLWRKSGYMLLSTSSIVGFLRLYRHFIKSKIGDKDIAKYIRKINVDFSHDDYLYTSSQWGRLESNMLKDIRSAYKFGNIDLISKKHREQINKE